MNNEILYGMDHGSGGYAMTFWVSFVFFARVRQSMCACRPLVARHFRNVREPI